MTQITVDQELADRLREESTEIEFRSPDGTVLGMFRSEKLQHLYAEAKCPVSEEELERRRREEGGRTLSEIIADLEPKG